MPIKQCYQAGCECGTCFDRVYVFNLGDKYLDRCPQCGSLCLAYRVGSPAWETWSGCDADSVYVALTRKAQAHG